MLELHVASSWNWRYRFPDLQHPESIEISIQYGASILEGDRGAGDVVQNVVVISRKRGRLKIMMTSMRRSKPGIFHLQASSFKHSFLANKSHQKLYRRLPHSSLSSNRPGHLCRVPLELNRSRS